MNELIPILLADIGGEQIQTCNARELHKFLGVGKDFSTWVKVQIERAGFVDGTDYVKIPEKSSSPKKGEQANTRAHRLFFHDPCGERDLDDEQYTEGQGGTSLLHRMRTSCERSDLICSPRLYQPSIAAREWAKQYELRQALEHKVKQDAPKIDFAEAVTASDAEHTITEAAKVLSIRPRKFFDWLRANGFIYKQSTQAMQFSINKGLMVTRFHTFKHTDGELDKKAHARITGKGLYFFYQRLRHEGLIERNPNLELTA